MGGGGGRGGLGRKRDVVSKRRVMRGVRLTEIREGEGRKTSSTSVGWCAFERLNTCVRLSWVYGERDASLPVPASSYHI